MGGGSPQPQCETTNAGNQKLKAEKRKLKSKKRICSEVSVNSPWGIRGVSAEEEKEGYGVKYLQITMNRDLNSASSPDQCARVRHLLNCYSLAAPQTQAPPTPLHPPSSRLRIVHFGIGAGARSVASRGGRTAQRDGTARSLVHRAAAAAAAAWPAGGLADPQRCVART